MSKTLLIRFVFVTLFAVPFFSLANVSSSKTEKMEVMIQDSSKEGGHCSARAMQRSFIANKANLSFAACSLFVGLRATLVSTFDLVIGVLSHVFLVAGSELSNKLIK